MNRKGDIFYKFKTLKQTREIKKWLVDNKIYIRVERIEKEAGTGSNALARLLSGRCNTLNPKDIQKILPILRQIGFVDSSITKTSDDIISFICKKTKIPFVLMLSDTRRGTVMEEKKILMHLVHTVAEECNKNIAKKFKCSTSNVSQTLKKVKERCEVDKMYAAKIVGYVSEIKSLI